MPRPRLPEAVATATGAALKDPQRHRNRSAPKRTRPLGEPYKRMSDHQCEAWEEFRSEIPWLNSSHRSILEVACVVKARLIAGEDVGVSALQMYQSILSKLAATPVDETRISYGEDDDADPAEAYLN